MSARPANRPKSINFDAQQLKELKQLFDSIDTDGDGQLDENELTKFLEQNDIPSSEAKLATFLFDSDKDGKLSWIEFLQFMDASAVLDSDPEKFFKFVFDAVDTDHSGFLDLTII